MTSYCALIPPSWGLVALLPETHAFTGWDDSGTAFSTAAADGNTTDPEGKLWWGWWELGRSACPCPTADRLGQSSERGVQVTGEDYTAAGESSVPGTSPSLGADLGCW